MKKNAVHKSRRAFIKTTGMATAGIMLTPGISHAMHLGNDNILQPALLGGAPVRTKSWPTWPQWNSETDEKLVVDDLRSGIWSRAALVDQFEAEWAKATGTKRCLSVVNGTNALIASLLQMNIGGGDEVIIPVYTFIATAAAVLATGAIPVFVDTDINTFQIDVAKIEQKITARTKAIIPVHILGMPADMENIMKIAKKYNLKVIEDACQAHYAEINHKRVGSFGDAGCFSFQNSKNLAIGEGGAITSNDDSFMDHCYSYHNYGNPYGALVGNVNAGTIMAGNKLRWTEYQAAIGLVQMKRLEAQTEKRNVNAAYLRSKIKDIPGITPYTLYDNVTRATFHLFSFRYNKAAFKDLPRSQFIKAMNAEGVPCMEGYAPLNKMPYLANAFQSKNYKRMYSAKELDIKSYQLRNECPVNDKLCNEEMVWIFHALLLAEKEDMNDISNAIEKVHSNAEALKKAMK
ncbi:MAG: DegT/DnrJ/EryC1/StrS family aminotransferase [Chitinophagaceae bacterium]|nr:DegT/DnrJ/EryC1/StrS family aminotransferase [Chitinophagaceae bacterium]